MRHFHIYYNGRDVTVQDARDAIQNEMTGPVKLLGYRAMHLKLRQKYDLNLPRDLVYNIMSTDYKDVLEERRPGIKKKGRKKLTLQQKDLTGFSRLMATINLWAIRILHSLWQSMAVWTLQAERFYS